MNDEKIFSEALRHHFSGRFEPAERAYRDVLSRDPAHADALHHLGLIDLHFGRIERAVVWIRKSVLASPNQPDAFSNLAYCLAVSSFKCNG